MKKMLRKKPERNVAGILRMSSGIMIVMAMLTGCSGKEGPVFFKKIPSGSSGIDFINAITESDSVNVVSFTNIYNGGGVGVADFNFDGFPDLFFTGNMVSSRLYLNQADKGSLRFRDISEEAGIFTDRWATGVSIADVNEDGLPDVYVCVSGSDIPARRQNYLFIHQGLNEKGIPFFREMAVSYGLADQTYSTQAAFFDYDLDGDLDLFVAVNFADQFYGASVNIPTPNKKGYTDRSDRLYKNLGPGKDGHPVFMDVSVEAGILHEGYTLGLVIQDINLDGWPDIYQANDFLSNDIFYENQGDGTFINRIGRYFKHTTFAGMGMDISDFNNDEWPDIFVLDMTPADNYRQKSMMLPVRTDRFAMNLQSGYYPQYNRNTLQLNNGHDPDGDLSFSEIGQLAGIHHTDWSWTALFSDVNNDGLRDLMVNNGFRRDLQDIDHIHYLFGDNPFGTREHWEKQFVQKVMDIPGIHVNNYLFENNGDLTFSDRSAEWGFVHPGYSNGGVTADLDNDGDLDVIINNLDDFPFLYENLTIPRSGAVGENQKYLKIRLENGVFNASTAGAKITLRHGERAQFHQHYVVRGYLSSLDPVMHFGLGMDTLVQEVRVVWPDGHCRVIRNIWANQTLVIDRGISNCDTGIEKIHDASIFEDVSDDLKIDFRHQEFEYDDFIFQPLLLQKHSLNGPGMAAGDVNGDGLEDLVVGGARGQLTAILLQQPDGKFLVTSLKGTENYEDMGLLLFDPDLDGDLDLYAVSGSSEHGKNMPSYTDRFYVNDGSGSFSLSQDALPGIFSSGSCVLSADYDGDGDPDLYVGGRILPREFPYAPDGYLLRNDSRDGNIHFTDVTDSFAPELRRPGMVSTGLFTDFNNDGLPDLVLAGEWMPVNFYENTGSSFRLLTGENGLEFSNGMWNSIIAADFDKDGDMDYIVGNLGLNSWLKASPAEPLSMFADDFDRNGHVDPLVFHYVHGKIVPFHPRSLLIAQLNYLEQHFPTYRDFAAAGLESILDEDQIQKAVNLNIYELRSCYIENLGENRFLLKPLPVITQSAPVFGLLADDFDGDGNFDVLLGGNSKASNLTLGWYDASIGYMLKGRGDGSFTVLDGTETHFYVDRDVKSMVQLNYGNSQPLILVANNDDSLAVFRKKKVSVRAVKLPSGCAYGYYIYRDNSRQKVEFYLGQGYLSARGDYIFPGSEVTGVEIFGPNHELLQSVDLD
jgi:enediyne biosynthesis protein E4